VWYGTANNSAGAQQFATEPTTTTATITGLANGTTYYVWVKAKNGAGTSGFSPAASGTPSGANTKLSALALAQHNGTTNPYPLYRQKMSPDFTSATTQYTLEVNYWVDYLLIEATRSDANAVVSSTAAQGSPTVAGNKYTFRFMLNPGDNTIPITVTNGTAAQTYTITINRDTEYTASQKTASVNQIPPWTKGYWAFEFLRSVEALLIDTSPRQAGSGGFGYLEFCDMFEMGLAWIAGDIVYSQAFSPKSGVFILKLDRDNTMAYIDGGDYYAIYWFDKRGSGVRPNGVTSGGMKTRFFQSNTEALAAGANTLNDAKTTFIVDDWYFSHLTQIWGVGDPQIKRSDDPDYQFTPTGGDDWLD
jgi:hypothetical protein